MNVKEELIQLWKTAFHDTDDFIRLFFDRIFTEENAVYIRKDSRIVSALHMVAYTFLYRGNRIPVYYKCGVATLPNEQGKGLMRSLMAKAGEIIRERQVPLAALIPAENRLFDVYRKMGYKNFFNFALHTYQYTRLSSAYSVYELLDYRNYSVETIYISFDSFYRKRDNYINHTWTDFQLLLQDQVSSGHDLMVLSDAKEIAGMAFIDNPTHKRNLFVRELLYRNGQERDILLHLLCVRYGVDEITYKLPAAKENSHPYGMIRIILPQLLPEPFPAKGYMNLMLD